MPLFKSHQISHGKLNSFQLQPFSRPHSSISFEPVIRAIGAIRFESVANAFESKEHIKIGDSVIENIPVLSLFKGKAFKWGDPAVALSYGDIIALAGDYYATADHEDNGYTGTRRLSNAVARPLCDAPDVADSLDHATKDKDLKNAEGETEEETIKKHLENLILSQAESSVHDLLVSEEEVAAAIDWLEQRTDTELRYYLLTLENWDHFHPHCEKRYHSLHRRAKTIASINGGIFGKAVRQYMHQIAADSPLVALFGALTKGVDLFSISKELIAPAVRLNAFADHFLTDAFSSGHLFGTRQEIISDPKFNDEAPSDTIFYPNPNIDPEQVLVTVSFKNPSESVSVRMGEVAGSAWAKISHDKWSKSGVRVRCDTCTDQSVRGKEFTAYGDGYAPDLANLLSNEWWQSAELATKHPQAYLLACAVASSICEVLDAFFVGADLGIRATLGKSLHLDRPWDYVFHAVDKRCNCTPSPEPRYTIASL